MASEYEWEQKLISFGPGWIHSAEPINVQAVYKGMAAMLASFEEDLRDNIAQTFIDQAEGAFLDLHGQDRNKERIDGETRESYRARIKSISDSSSCPKIKEIVDTVLVNGESVVVDSEVLTSYFDSNYFLDNNFILSASEGQNEFTILVNEQRPKASYFFDSNFYFDSESYLGNNRSVDSVLDAIVAIVESSKAFGTSWSLIERRV